MEDFLKKEELKSAAKYVIQEAVESAFAGVFMGIGFLIAMKLFNQ